MSTQSVGGNGSNSISMNFNGMPMQMPMHMNMNLPTGFRFNFGAGPLNLSDVVFNDVHSTFMHNPFFSSMINNQNNLEDFVDNLNINRMFKYINFFRHNICNHYSCRT